MNNKTGGILGTIAAAVLCGLPGIVLACMGVIAVLGGQSPEILGDNAKWQSTMLGAVMFLIVGMLLMLVPMIVGFITLRRKSGPATVAAVATEPAPAAMPQVAPMPAPAPRPTAQPVATTAPAPQVTHAPGLTDASAQVVYDRIMALNRPSAPYQIVDGKAKNVDLIAEWKIVDARWYEIFAKANLTKVFRIHMKLDPAQARSARPGRGTECRLEGGCAQPVVRGKLLQGAEELHFLRDRVRLHGEPGSRASVQIQVQHQ